jgi:hypothetical protein
MGEGKWIKLEERSERRGDYVNPWMRKELERHNLMTKSKKS